MSQLITRSLCVALLSATSVAVACPNYEKADPIHGKPVVITATSGIYFASGSVKPLKPSRVEEVLRPYLKERIRRVEVIGHADGVPPSKRLRKKFRDNDALSLARARVIADIVASVTGLSQADIGVAGCGDRIHKISRSRAEDRRVVELAIFIDNPSWWREFRPK